MKTSYKLAFVSNYINHHQIPFCNAMNRLTEGRFTFIQTEPMEEQRVRMGWNQEDRPPYVKCFYEEETVCRQLILDCDVVLGGVLSEFLAPYLPRLREYVAGINPFDTDGEYVHLSTLRRHTVPLGVALHFVTDFLEQI